MSPMKVMVLGASGPLGREIVKEVLKRGHQVTALVRSPEKFDMQHEHLAVMKGDVLDGDTLNRPMAGTHAVISSLGVKPTWKEVTFFSESTKDVLRCMQRHNARRFICITGVGAGVTKDHGGLFYNWFLFPLFLKKIYEDKTRQEDIVRFCDRDWVVVRPARLTNAKATSEYGVIKDVRGVQTSSVSRADVAAFCADQLESNKYLYQFPLLTDL